MSRHLWITDFSSGSLPASNCHASVYDEGNAKYTVNNEVISTKTLRDFVKAYTATQTALIPTSSILAR